MGKEKPKKKGYRSYLNDFKPSISGEYIYSGNHYGYADDGKELKRFNVQIRLLAMLIFASAVVGGCIPSAGMDECFYVIIPFIIEVITAAVTGWAVIRLNTAQIPLREYVYNSTVKQLPLRAAFCEIFAAIGFVCAAVYVIINGFDGKLAATVIYFVLKLISMFGCYLLRRIVKSSKWQIIAPDADDSQAAEK